MPARKKKSATSLENGTPTPLPPPLSIRLAQSGILAAAVTVFARQGVAATRVEDLLAAAGVARRTFYKYFRSKEEVLAALYDLATGELVRAMQAAQDQNGERGKPAGYIDPYAGIWRGIDLYLDYHIDNAALLKVLVEQAIRSDSPLAPLRQRFRGQLTALLQAAVRATTGERFEPLMYAALISALEGVSLQLLDADAPSEPRARSRQTRSRQIDRAKKVMRTLLARVLGATARQARQAR